MDGVDFKFFMAPIAISEVGVLCRSTHKVTDADGKVRLEQIEGTETCFPADSVVIATGQAPRGNLKGLEIGKTGLVITDEVGRTTNKAVFASGDVVTGAKTVVEAVELSKKSAQAIMEYVESLPKSD